MTRKEIEKRIIEQENALRESLNDLEKEKYDHDLEKSKNTIIGKLQIGNSEIKEYNDTLLEQYQFRCDLSNCIYNKVDYKCLLDINRIENDIRSEYSLTDY